MRKTAICTLTMSAVGLVAGCNTFDVDSGQSLILKAEDRVLLTKRNDDGPRIVGGNRDVEVAGLGTSVSSASRLSSPTPEVGSHARRLVCAEPSPDAISSLAWSSAASASLFGQGEGSIAAGLAESAASIGLRTGSIQILRDLGYRACEGVMNGVIGAPSYNMLIRGVDVAAIGLEALGTLSTKPAAAQPAISSNAPGVTTKSAPTITRPAATPSPGASPASPSSGAPSSITGNTEATVTSGGNAVLSPGTAPVNSPSLSVDAATAVVRVVCLTTIAAPTVTASLQERANGTNIQALVEACMKLGG